MAREYKVELTRDGINPELYVHDNWNIELINADSGAHVDYLIKKLAHIKDMVAWMKQYGVTKIECTKV